MQPLALKAAAAFPKKEDTNWIHYSHYNEDKCGITDSSKMPLVLASLIADLSCQLFVKELESLTGITNLRVDPDLQGGGLHLTKAGGYLNVHADFTVHPLKRDWRRRVNLLLYLNHSWSDSYEGHLELWSKDMKNCVHRISPLLNKCVIFNTDGDSFHGVPVPLKCPPNTTRNSVALYYYTEEITKTKLKATNYQARPFNSDDNQVLIWLDKLAVATYTRIKSKLRLSDQAMGSFLKKIRRKPQ